jgi:HEAT repeat protein
MDEQTKQQIETLIAALADDHWEVRWNAAATLGEFRAQQAVEPLIQALDDENKYVRQCAAAALGYIGAPQAVDALLVTLDDRDDSVRIAATHALGWIGDKRAIDPLIAHLNGATYDDATTDALVSLGEPAFFAIIQLLNNGSSAGRAHAALALRRFPQQHEWGGEMVVRWAIAPLIAALTDDDPQTRATAAATLGALGDPRAIEPLDTLRKDPDPRVRHQAAAALALFAPHPPPRPAGDTPARGAHVPQPNPTPQPAEGIVTNHGLWRHLRTVWMRIERFIRS